MDLATLRNKIEFEGGVIAALEYGIRDEDIDDEDMSEMWYELQVAYDNLYAEAGAFEDELNNRLMDEGELD